MSDLKTRSFLLLAFCVPFFGSGALALQEKASPTTSPLDVRIARFDVTDAIVRDALSELSLRNVDGLHLGFEEIIREKIQDDPRTVGPHFSLHLTDRTVRQILDAICESDPRYTWSEDRPSINVYLRAPGTEALYLLELEINRIQLYALPDPDQALTPLWKAIPQQQIGYAGGGGENGYAEPWTVTFEHLTVRQFINRIAEHMGPQTSWVWQGGKSERMFTFLKGGFHTSHTTR